MKFDPTNGAKAYSYFGTIVKRWLINYNNKNYKKLKQIGSWDDVADGYVPEQKDINDVGITLAQFIDKWVEGCYDELEELFKKEHERRIADAVLTLFKTRNDLEIFKKKALYIYIREMTDCDTPNLTRVITKLKLNFKDKYQKLYDEGLISNKVL
jgi:transposase